MQRFNSSSFAAIAVLSSLSPFAHGQCAFNTAYGTSALASVTTGCFDAAFGTNALELTTTGSANTATGNSSLENNTTGYNDTAVGSNALYTNTTGADNTAVGENALEYNTTGGNNTAVGTSALEANTTGASNTAVGGVALVANTTGSFNTALGGGTLGLNTTGVENTALGAHTLLYNTIGGGNTAAGAHALTSNTTGFSNTAVGDSALDYNTTGGNNTAVGTNALVYSTTGSSNIAVGYEAGTSVTTGSNNIEIGSPGTATDNNIIRIGVEGRQAKAFIAGIYNTPLTGNAVFVTSSGQLGVTGSSERFKTAIAPMGSNTAKLEQLRPVSFHFKNEPDGAIQYGLIAEEVAKIYPELVIRDENGRIDGVRYDELSPMLLNEMQKDRATIAAQNQKIVSLEQKVAEVDDLKQQLSAVIQELKAQDKLVAQR